MVTVDTNNLQGETEDKAREFWNQMNLCKLKLYVCFGGDGKRKTEVFCLRFLSSTRVCGQVFRCSL